MTKSSKLGGFYLVFPVPVYWRQNLVTCAVYLQLFIYISLVIFLGFYGLTSASTDEEVFHQSVYQLNNVKKNYHAQTQEYNRFDVVSFGGAAIGI